MERDDETRHLLRDIRDAQREQLAEYRGVTERVLELQRRALAQQEQLSRLHRRLVRVGGSLVAVLAAVLIFLVLIYYLLSGWSRYLFGV
jgi:ferric-dicitrate binding protein FerR (iron transport regulator)